MDKLLNPKPLADRLATRFAFLMATLHLVLGAFFAISLVAATEGLASEGTVCDGVDLGEKLKREEPEAYARIVAEAAGIPNGNGIFWRISKAGKVDSHLFGTMHSPDPRVTELPENVAAAFARSETVLVENTQALDPQQAAKAMRSLTAYTLLPEGETLEDILDEGTLSQLRELLGEREMPWEAAKRMQPWLLATSISISPCEMAARSQGHAVLDARIAIEARELGKDLHGLETMEEQFAAIHGLSEKFHVGALEEILETRHLVDDLMETTKQIYLDGRISMMLPIARHLTPKAFQGHGYAEFRERLLSRRNRTMADRAAPHLEKGGVFMAVGALHLPGEDGLVAMFRDAGFEVESISR